MDVASGGIDQEEDLAWGLERHLAEGYVPVVRHGSGRGELVAREGVVGGDESGGVGVLLC